MHYRRWEWGVVWGGHKKLPQHHHSGRRRGPSLFSQLIFQVPRRPNVNSRRAGLRMIKKKLVQQGRAAARKLQSAANTLMMQYSICLDLWENNDISYFLLVKAFLSISRVMSRKSPKLLPDHHHLDVRATEGAFLEYQSDRGEDRFPCSQQLEIEQLLLWSFCAIPSHIISAGYSVSTTRCMLKVWLARISLENDSYFSREHCLRSACIVPNSL